MLLDHRFLGLALVSGLGLCGCRSLPTLAEPSLTLTRLESPGPGAADRRAQFPRLTGSGERLVLSWTEDLGEGRWGLFHSRVQEDGVAPATLVAQGRDWFVNWADFPAVVAGSDGLFAHWLRRDAANPHAYHVEYALTGSEGAWSEPRTLHDDRSEVEHGFVTTLAGPDGFFSVWLDGRQPGTTKLIGRGLNPAPDGEVELDLSTCSCCPTTAVYLADGSMLVAYRDRSPNEVRDIAIVRGKPGDPSSWSRPRVPNPDGWRIPGCPVNGPALAVGEERIAMAWFTMGSDETPRVKVAFSTDGTSFGWPTEVDDGLPGGRVSIAPVPGKDAFVVGWLEMTGERAQWRARLLENGVSHGSVVLAGVEGGRPDGMLSLAAGERDVFATWTDRSTGSLGLTRIHNE